MMSLTSSKQKILIRCSLGLNLVLILYIALGPGFLVTAPPPLKLLSGPPAPRSIKFADCEPNSSAGGAVAVTSEKEVPPTVISSTLPIQDKEPVVGRPISPGVYCYDKEQKTSQSARRNFWVLYNYFLPEKIFRCNESITYSTHGDFTFLDNLEPLLERWQGPVSLSMYAPGDDFRKTVDTIMYYRECRPNKLVKDYVSFHLYFDLSHIPSDLAKLNAQEMSVDCAKNVSWGEGFNTYKKENKLDYPVNIARNVARLMSTTHFVFPSDIELYPSPNLIPTFLQMVKRDDGPGNPLKPRVYVNSIFEIRENHTLPRDKAELQSMLKAGTVIPFHKFVCASCHNIPFAKAWRDSAPTEGMTVTHIGKRNRPYHHWEPIYIGTNAEPLYDERLTWEGRSDKMVQGHKICLLDYEFHILDNAFLVHRPGIKTKAKLKSALQSKKVGAQNSFLKKTVFPELKAIYGERKGCEMF